MRPIVILGGIIAAAVLVAAPVAAHEGHPALPEGFEARMAETVGSDGSPVALDDVAFVVSPDGIGLTVTNTGDRVLEVTGEQAGEPLVRLIADTAEVNATSPQAVDVDGAAVDAAAAAELIDLVWDRVEPVWVALPNGGTVEFIDHRAAPGHPPVREDFATGDIAGEWRVAFTYGGQDYELRGHNVAVPVSGSALSWPMGLPLVGALAAAWVLTRPAS